MDKRTFLKNSAILGLGGAIAGAFPGTLKASDLVSKEHFGGDLYKLPELGFAYDALEPHIDAMTMKPVMVKPDTSMKECARIMADSKVGSLIIKEDEKLLGIIKERDIVRTVVLENVDASKAKVKDYMVRDVVTISPEVDIYDALVTMKDYDVRMLPVLDGKELIGLLTVKDILKIEPQLFELLAEKLVLREEERKPIYNKR